MKEKEDKPKQREIISDFISIVSHELRAPLAIIKENISQIYEGILGKSSKEQGRALEISLKSVDRLNRLVNELTDVSRLERGKFKLQKRGFNLLDLTEEVFHGFEKIVKKQGKTLSYDVLTHRENLEIIADYDKLTQVLVNLIHNALNHTDEGDNIKIGVRSEKDKAYIFIADNGRGIPEEHLPHVFKKYHQASGQNQGAGLGLGLTIAEQIIKLHQGQIAVKSILGKETEFIIELPYTRSEKCQKRY